MVTNNPSSDRFSVTDELRLIALEQWLLTVRKIAHVESEIVTLACLEAHRYYQMKALGMHCITFDSFLADLTTCWATWQAHVSVNITMGKSVTDRMNSFTAELETFINEQITPVLDNPFLS